MVYHAGCSHLGIHPAGYELVEKKDCGGACGYPHRQFDVCGSTPAFAARRRRILEPHYHTDFHQPFGKAMCRRQRFRSAICRYAAEAPQMRGTASRIPFFLKGTV